MRTAPGVLADGQELVRSDLSQPPSRRTDPEHPAQRLRARARGRVRRSAGPRRRPVGRDAELYGPRAPRPPVRRGPSRARAAPERGRRHLQPERARVRGRLPRGGFGRRGEHDGERALHGGRARLPAPGRPRALPLHGPGAPRARAPGSPRGPGGGGLRLRRGRGRDAVRIAPRGERRPADPGDRHRRPRRVAAVLERHDGLPQGRHAHASQPRGQRAADGRGPAVGAGGRRRGRPAVLPQLRADGGHEHEPPLRGDRRDDAALRPRAVPGALAGARSDARLRRAAARARPRQAPARRGLRPVDPALHACRERRPSTPSSPGPARSAWAARSCRATASRKSAPSRT